MQRVWLVLLAALVAPAAALAAGAADPPSNTAAPTIAGSTAQGATLTATNGTWSGDAPLSYAVQWLRCDTGGQSCVLIAGENASTHVLTSDDVGHTIVVRVTATNAAGEASKDSSPTAVVASSSGPKPVNTALPTINGSASLGGTLTVATGTWTGTPAPTFTYAWQQCNPSGTTCTAIPGATSASYKVQVGDVGGTLRASVTATNSAGSSVAQTAVTPLVTAGSGPLATTPPSIVGSAQVGSTVTVSNGSWSGSGLVQYAYAWERCNAQGGGCTAIANAADRTYVVATADSGSRLRASVTATDGNGSSTAVTNLTGVVGSSQTGSGAGSGLGIGVAGAPVPVEQPIVSGLLEAGARLATDDGGWTSAPGIRFAEAWLRCDAKGAACTPMRTRGATYRLTRADVGHTIRSRITATNATGPATATSDPTGVIGAGPAIRLRGGRYSIPVASLGPKDKLVIAHVARGKGRTVRVTVRDRHGYAVRGVVVSAAARGLRAVAARTGTTGIAVLRLRSGTHGRLALTVRARAGSLRATRVVRLRLR